MVQWAFEPADEATVAALIDKGGRWQGGTRRTRLQRWSALSGWPPA